MSSREGFYIYQNVNGKVESIFVESDIMVKDQYGVTLQHTWRREVEAFFPWSGIVQIIRGKEKDSCEKEKGGTDNA